MRASKTAPLGPMLAPGATPASDDAGTQVAHNVAIQIGKQQARHQFGFLDQLHAHVVDDSFLEFDVGVTPWRHAVAVAR